MNEHQGAHTTDCLVRTTSDQTHNQSLMSPYPCSIQHCATVYNMMFFSAKRLVHLAKFPNHLQHFWSSFVTTHECIRSLCFSEILTGRVWKCLSKGHWNNTCLKTNNRGVCMEVVINWSTVGQAMVVSLVWLLIVEMYQKRGPYPLKHPPAFLWYVSCWKILGQNIIV